MKQTTLNIDLKQLALNLEKIKQAQILVIDNDETHSAKIIQSLRNKEFKAHSANNGLEAIRLVRNLSVIQELDLILMDIHIPTMNGYETTNIIRQDHRFKHTPIIAMSSEKQIKSLEHYHDAAMNDYLQKPVKLNELYLTLIKWIKIDPRQFIGDIQQKLSFS